MVNEFWVIYLIMFKVLGTPTEETWEGVTALPNYNLRMFSNSMISNRKSIIL